MVTRVDGYADHAGDRPHGRAFHQHGQDLNTFGEGQLVHAARDKELQIIVSTHSPYILAELPPEGRIYLMDGIGGREVVTGVSPEFAMTRMDEEQHPECDVYVEDQRAAALVAEALVA